jgi:hypothetical protein
MGGIAPLRVFIPIFNDRQGFWAPLQPQSQASTLAFVSVCTLDIGERYELRYYLWYNAPDWFYNVSEGQVRCSENGWHKRLVFRTGKSVISKEMSCTRVWPTDKV